MGQSIFLPLLKSKPTLLFCSLIILSGCRESVVTNSGYHELPSPSGRIAELVELLQSSDRQVAYDAARELGAIGSKAKSAIPALIKLATSHEEGSYRVHPSLQAQKALASIDTDLAVQGLIESLIDPNQRFWAARILGDWGSVSMPAIPGLVEALRGVTRAQSQDQIDASAQAAASLGRIGPEGISALISEMSHQDPRVRELAIWATPRGEAGIPAIGTLSKCLSDDDADVRQLAALAIADIGPAASVAESKINRALETEKVGQVRYALRSALEAIKQAQ